jgi:hypothetical protein
MNRRKVPLIPLVLFLLALADLKLELRLLVDHFTFTTALVAIQNHLLAVTTLALLPSLWRHYRRDQA